MPKPVNIAIVAALKRELAPLLGTWERSSLLPGGCYEKGDNVAVIGGIGPRAAHSVTERLLQVVTPRLLVSAGMAGALTSAHRVGDVLIPKAVISETGEKFLTGKGMGTLLTVGGVAGTESKRNLAKRFAAEAADMEAAVIAQVAARHGVEFMAVKAISDELDFPMPDMSGYITPEGSFSTSKLIAHAVLHPRMWGVLLRLKSNSDRAASRLCEALQELIDGNAPAEVGDAGSSFAKVTKPQPVSRTCGTTNVVR
jgi:adenosylhomocysteine nucleosidase